MDTDNIAREGGEGYLLSYTRQVERHAKVLESEKATLEKGEKYLNSILPKLANLYKEISETDIDDIYI